jgi:hypothetical protein
MTRQNFQSQNNDSWGFVQNYVDAAGKKESKPNLPVKKVLSRLLQIFSFDSIVL